MKTIFSVIFLLNVVLGVKDNDLIPVNKGSVSYPHLFNSSRFMTNFYANNSNYTTYSE